MASIDDLFKKPSLPSNKRKLEITRDPNEVYKSIKLSPNGDAKRNGHTTVKDEDEDDGIAGPELPPDQEEEAPDDEEGRFFGGGITSDTAEVLDFIDGRDREDTGPERIDAAWVRKLALNFERRISKNAELRAKFEEEPQKFMGSEADLDADVKALSILSEHSDLYEEFAKLGCVASLVSLLAHENTDIAIDAIEIISELTDEDVEAEQKEWDILVDAMLDSDLLDLLSQNISRLNESNESDRNGIYHALSVLENLSSRPSIAGLIGKDTSVMAWLVSRVQRRESTVGQNKQYAAEVLAILLQSSPANQERFIEMDGVDIFLQRLSAYRKRDPEKGTEEEEYVENVFDCVTCSVDVGAGKSKFLEAEGVELCLIMLREGKMSRPRALRLLDHALGGQEGSACCERLVEAAGLKTVFSMFMRKHDNEMTEHLLGILASLLRSLPGDSAPRIRTLAKFVEKNYEKIERLVQLRRGYSSKLATVEQEIRSEKASNSIDEWRMTDEWLSRRLDAGLFSLQTVDVILAWLVAEDDGAKTKVQKLLAERDESLSDLKATIQEQLEGMDAGSEDLDNTLKDMLGTLVQFL
ncbi:MAG: hypothetical protein FRX48_00301 [Lasallia pustulata]|uniref:Beta-catenin-like protein 1 N-terminal domain-containing protein n=1 Tax=Lasallia pustulata TaxID=136370 RepID=A0A5M8Q2Z6_9LECA|nr:MAG: hypothetical protein FRX48_00301 [Lasallia pustulata]